MLLSHALSGAVPSPCQVLASGFGMGPGVSPGPWPPQILCCRGTRGFPGGWRVGDRMVDACLSFCGHGPLFRVACVSRSLRCGDALPPLGVGCVSCFPVSTGRLHPLRGFHVRPIDHVFCMGGSKTRGSYGILILERASRLDAFSGYPFRTQPTGGATGVTTGVPEVRPPRSSRTMGRSPQYSDERRG